jgi:hypothetical protein
MKRHAFYILGATDFQDSLPIIVESTRRGHPTWVCFLDITNKKRQFYYYSKTELFNFIKNIFSANGIKCPTLSFFSKTERKEYEKSYNSFLPEIIFTQHVNNTNVVWPLYIGDSKIIHLTWTIDGVKNYNSSLYKNQIVLNIERLDPKTYDQSDKFDRRLDFISIRASTDNCKAPFVYFGKFWDDHFLSSIMENNKRLLSTIPKNKKICFLPETVEAHGAGSGSQRHWNDESCQELDLLFSYLKSNNYFIILKKREKGYPQDKSLGYTNFMKEKADLFIEKDLFFPSCLFFLPLLSDLCLILGFQTCGELDLYNYYNNDLKTPTIIEPYAKDLHKKVIKQINELPVNNIPKKYNPKSNTSQKLLDFIKKENI